MEFDIYFPLIEEILHGELHPERPKNADGHHYTIRLQELKVSPEGQTGRYSLRFIKPISPKTTWYRQMLISETNGYCLDAQEALTEEKNEFIRKYHRKQILDDHLTTCLMRVGEEIRKQGYRLSELENPPQDADRERLSNVYIFHLLKVCLIKAYLEVQELLSDVVGWKQTEESLCLGILQELPPVRRFLIRQDEPVESKKPAVSYPASQDTPKEEVEAMEGPQFYDTRKMCELYGCSESTLYRKVKSGGFPQPVDFMGKKMYGKKEVDAHLASLTGK